jgi:tetratricopeptide (TPR) repeat protein
LPSSEQQILQKIEQTLAIASAKLGALSIAVSVDVLPNLSAPTRIRTRPTTQIDKLDVLTSEHVAIEIGDDEDSEQDGFVIEIGDDEDSEDSEQEDIAIEVGDDEDGDNDEMFSFDFDSFEVEIIDAISPPSPTPPIKSGVDGEIPIIEMLEDEESQVSDDEFELVLEVDEDEDEDDSELDSDFDSDYEDDQKQAVESVEDEDSEPESDIGSVLDNQEDIAAKRERTRRDNDMLRLCLKQAAHTADLGEYQRAIELYSDALDIDQHHLTARLSRGRIYLDFGDYGRAMSDFTKAVDRHAESPEPSVAIGEMYFTRKDYTNAIDNFNDALKMSPNHAIAHCKRGISHYHKRNYRVALADLTRAQKLDATIPNIRNYVNMARKRTKN